MVSNNKETSSVSSQLSPKLVFSTSNGGRNGRYVNDYFSDSESTETWDDAELFSRFASPNSSVLHGRNYGDNMRRLENKFNEELARIEQRLSDMDAKLQATISASINEAFEKWMVNNKTNNGA